MDRAFSEVHKAQQALEEAYLKRCKASLILKTCRINIGDVQERIRESKEARVKSLVSLVYFSWFVNILN